MEDNDTQQLKIVFIGDSSVGKTTIIQRYISARFEACSQPTVGSMFFTKELEVNGKDFKLQIWDTAGQERFQSIAPLYFRDAHGVIVTFDVTNRDSFHNLSNWIQKLEDLGPERLAVCLIGNKIDLEDEREITTQEMKELAEDMGACWQETSAMDDLGVHVSINIYLYLTRVGSI